MSPPPARPRAPLTEAEERVAREVYERLKRGEIVEIAGRPICAVETLEGHRLIDLQAELERSAVPYTYRASLPPPALTDPTEGDIAWRIRWSLR